MNNRILTAESVVVSDCAETVLEHCKSGRVISVGVRLESALGTSVSSGKLFIFKASNIEKELKALPSYKF